MYQSILCTGSVILAVVLLCHGQPSSKGQHERLHRVRRIVGGHQPQKKDSYEYVASIRNLEYNKLKHICGGSYIGNGWVLTAAHCFVGRDWRRFYVRLGVDNLSAATSAKTYKVDDVQRTNFVSLFMTNDIALMRIDLQGDTPPFIPYATQKQQLTEPCEIGGFGSPAFNAPLSETFQVAKINVVPMFNCVLKLGYMVLPSLNGNILCVGGGGTDTCQGDSGSGLICNGVLTGITSYGRDCGVPGVPAIYTNVEHYASWMSSIVNGQ